MAIKWKTERQLFIEKRLPEIRQELQAMDYKTSKHADGEYTDEEWAKIVEVRKALRLELNKLELELGE